MSFPWAVIRGFRSLLRLSARASGISSTRFGEEGEEEKEKAWKTCEAAFRDELVTLDSANRL